MGAFPWPRALIAATLLTTATVVGHSVTGRGHGSPSTLSVVVLFGLFALGVRLTQGAPGRFARTFTVLAGGQLVGHLVLALTAGVGHSGAHQTLLPAGSPAGLAQLAHHASDPATTGLRRSSAAVGPEVMSAAAAAIADLASPMMLLGHTAAAVAAAWWLARGEALALRILIVATTVLRQPLRFGAVQAVASSGPTAIRRAVLCQSTRIEVSVLSRRGPPAPLTPAFDV